MILSPHRSRAPSIRCSSGRRAGLVFSGFVKFHGALRGSSRTGRVFQRRHFWARTTGTRRGSPGRRRYVRGVRPPSRARKSIEISFERAFIRNRLYGELVSAMVSFFEPVYCRYNCIGCYHRSTWFPYLGFVENISFLLLGSA